MAAVVRQSDGDSLLGARMISSVITVFGVDLPVDALFGEAATVVGMARIVTAARQANTSDDHG